MKKFNAAAAVRALACAPLFGAEGANAHAVAEPDAADVTVGFRGAAIAAGVGYL